MHSIIQNSEVLTQTETEAEAGDGIKKTDELITVQKLAKTISANSELSNREASRLITDLFKTITSKLSMGQKVRITGTINVHNTNFIQYYIRVISTSCTSFVTGFGTFSVIERSARTVRNPQNGELIQVPSKLAPKFSAASYLKAAIMANEEEEEMEPESEKE